MAHQGIIELGPQKALPYTTSNSGEGKSVLILGAGMVVRPIVHYLAGHGYRVLIASRTQKKAQELAEGAPNTSTHKFDVETDIDTVLDQLIPQVDAVVSLLPYAYHTAVAKRALAHSKHFFTTSYESDTMKALHQEAVAKGLVFINECGVDPGTDHMSAMQIIDDVTSKGGKITSFTSYCGGLPAPEDNNNPLGYKFSWSPRGVLLAGRNDAKFLEDGQEKIIPGHSLFLNHWTEYIELLGNEYETYPNRNSLPYIELYGLKDTKKMIRGTFRNKGWCRTIKGLVDLQLLELTERHVAGRSFLDLVKETLGTNTDDISAIKEEIAKLLKLDDSTRYVINNLEWLEIFNPDNKIADNIKTTLDASCELFQRKMQFAPGERDMLLMKHTFTAEYPDKKQKIECLLVDFGKQDGDTSMSRTVSLPVAISIRLVLEGKFTQPGLHIPSIPQLYNPILAELEVLGIKFHHFVTDLN